MPATYFNLYFNFQLIFYNIFGNISASFLSDEIHENETFFAQTEKIGKLSNVDETEKTDEKVKRKAELFEQERQERLSKLDEWKVPFNSLHIKSYSLIFEVSVLC